MMKKMILGFMFSLLVCLMMVSGVAPAETCMQDSECDSDAACSEDGVCVTCIDSDGGMDYTIAGSVSGLSYVEDELIYTDEEDFCYSGNVVLEYYCYSDGNTWVHTYQYSCLLGSWCEDGVCVDLSDQFNPQAIEDDGIEVAGAVEASKFVRGGSEGEVVEEEVEVCECVESDDPAVVEGGDDNLFFGTTTRVADEGYYTESGTDYCSSFAKLVEYTCKGCNEEIVSETIDCVDTYGLGAYCKSGACVEPLGVGGVIEQEEELVVMKVRDVVDISSLFSSDDDSSINVVVGTKKLGNKFVVKNGLSVVDSSSSDFPACGDYMDNDGDGTIDYAGGCDVDDDLQIDYVCGCLKVTTSGFDFVLNSNSEICESGYIHSCLKLETGVFVYSYCGPGKEIEGVWYEKDSACTTFEDDNGEVSSPTISTSTRTAAKVKSLVAEQQEKSSGFAAIKEKIISFLGMEKQEK